MCVGVLRYLKSAENAADYSVNNTVRQMLWLPTTWEEKYKAKQAIDTCFVRGGDVLAAGLLFLGTRFVALGTAGFARANIVIVLASIGVAVQLLREYDRLTNPRRVGVSWEPTGAAALALGRAAGERRPLSHELHLSSLASGELGWLADQARHCHGRWQLRSGRCGSRRHRRPGVVDHCTICGWEPLNHDGRY